MNRDVSNLETITIILSGLGTAWNPSRAEITLDALRDKLAAARSVMADSDRADAVRIEAINRRQTEFGNFSALLVRISRMAKVQIDDRAFLADLANIVRKSRYRSRDAAPVEVAPVDQESEPIEGAPETNGTASRARGHGTYDDRIALMEELLALLTTRGEEYRPNDADLTLDGIGGKLEQMRTAHAAAKSAIAAAAVQTAARRSALYDRTTGISRMVALIKAQTSASFGTQSQVLRQIVALRFSKAGRGQK